MSQGAATPPSAWLRKAEIATWILSVLGPFLYAPPASPLELSLDRPDLIYEGTRVLLTAFVIVLYYWISRKVPAGVWVVLALGTLLLGGGLFLRYHQHLTFWTIEYNGGLVVRGDELTDTAQKRAAEHGLSLDPIDHTRIFFLAGGEARDVWKDIPVIHARWRSLVLHYFGTVLAFTIMIVSCLQLAAHRQRKRATPR